jgi:hypothetical protein
MTTVQRRVPALAPLSGSSVLLVDAYGLIDHDGEPRDEELAFRGCQDTGLDGPADLVPQHRVQVHRPARANPALERGCVVATYCRLHRKGAAPGSVVALEGELVGLGGQS